MDKSTLLKGECKTLEFKAALSSKSESYLKTVVAIANAVSDSCAPKIVPDISFKTIEDKTVVLVDIAAGFNRPYMLKSGGLDKGVYVRVGATSRPADAEQIREMMLDGSNQSWDEQICRSYALTDRAVKKLCSDINRYRTEKDGQNAPKTTKETLIGWGVLKQDKTEVLPTNAFALLTDNPFGQAKIQCAVFKGESKSVFLDRKEYEGSLCRLLEDAYQYVLRNIRMGTGLQRIVDLAKQEGLKEPVFENNDSFFRVILYRGKEEAAQTTDQTVQTTEQKIMNAIAEKPTITRKELAEKTGLSKSGIKWQLDKLKKEQKILRAGGTFGGHWVVKK